MPRFSPFSGVRYSPTLALDDVIAPPYDVISPEDRAALIDHSPYNAVRLELPEDDDGVDRYTAAARLFGRWRDEGVLVADAPSFYGYRMDYADETGQPRHTTGVLGALDLEPPGVGILPHERTTPKDKADRLNLLRATHANLSPIWGLVPAGTLARALATDDRPTAVATDADGVVHTLWQLTDADQVAAIGEAIAKVPVVIADGHHRYEVGLAYSEEPGAAPGAIAILTYLVDLSEDELSVRAIHRLLRQLPDGFDVVRALRAHFEIAPTDPVDATITERMAAGGALALVTADGTWLLVPKPALVKAAEHDLDSSRLDVALATLPSHDVAFQHGWDRVASAITKGDAEAGVLLRPATVDQIAAVGEGGQRMPPKTTFFHPKLRTGLVFRSLDAE